MIEVVTSRNAVLYRDALEDMFELRQRRSGGIARCDVAAAECDGDEFDNEDALYLLLTAEDGTVIGSQRLLPTTGPHVFSERLGGLCAIKGVQRGEKILELTQADIDEAALDKAAAAHAGRRLAVGLLEFCLRAGYGSVTMLLPTDALFRRLLIGLDIKPLGLPVEIDGVRQIAVILTIDGDGYDAMRLAMGVPERQVVYIGAPDGDALTLASLNSVQRPLAAAE
jgi:acyl-homoserine lactone synthase